MTAEVTSWLKVEGRIYWSRCRQPTREFGFLPERDSSVIALIAGIYERDPKWARRIIRHRIHTTEALREASWGTVKVAARRVDFSCEDVPDFSGDSIEVVASTHTADEAISVQVQQLTENRRFGGADVVWSLLDQMTSEARKLDPRIVALPVSAVLLDGEGHVLSWGVNSAWNFRTQHAETNLIRRWNRMTSGGVPASLWVTRKPCKMCSGWIWDALLARWPVAIHFRDPDDGPLARTTVLDLMSFERRRAELARRG